MTAFEPMLGWIPVVIIAAIGWWIATHKQQAKNVIDGGAALFRKNPDEHGAQVKKDDDPHHPTTGGGGHEHDGGGKIVPILTIIAIVLCIWFVIRPWLDSVNERSLAQMSRAEEASPRAWEANESAIQMPELMSCSDGVVVATLAPGESVHVHVPDGTRADFTPTVDSGSISLCSFSDPSRCVMPGKTLRMDEDVFIVTNIRSGPGATSINLRCYSASL